MTIDVVGMTKQTKFSYNAKKLLNVEAEDLERVLKHYGVTLQGLEDMVRSVMEWFEKQPHLPQGQIHEQVVIRHIITKAFSVERVKEKIDSYYSAKQVMSDILSGREPMSPLLEEYFKRAYWVVLPKLTPDLTRITIFRCKYPGDISIVELIKMIFMIGDVRLWNDMNLGEHWILDFKNTNIQHAVQFTPTLISKIIFYLTTCAAPKVNGIHLVNLPSFAETALKLFKKAMKAKVLERMHLYNSFDEVLKLFPRSIFPRDLGGDEMSCEEISQEWLKTLQSPSWRKYFYEQDRIRTDESKRLMPSKINELFGVEGSFRKLDLD